MSLSSTHDDGSPSTGDRSGPVSPPGPDVPSGPSLPVLGTVPVAFDLDELRAALRWAVPSGERAQGGVGVVAVIFAIILAAAIAMVGVKVLAAIDQSISVTGSTYQNATESIAQGFAQSMGLLEIVFLVLMFVVVIGALFLARSAGAMGGGE